RPACRRTKVPEGPAGKSKRDTRRGHPMVFPVRSCQTPSRILSVLRAICGGECTAGSPLPPRSALEVDAEQNRQSLCGVSPRRIARCRGPAVERCCLSPCLAALPSGLRLLPLISQPLKTPRRRPQDQKCDWHRSPKRMQPSRPRPNSVSKIALFLLAPPFPGQTRAVADVSHSCFEFHCIPLRSANTSGYYLT